MQKQAHVFFTGDVQGVGFRYTVQHLARGYRVFGYVKNLSDGRVELLAQGDEMEIKDLIQAVRDSRMNEHIQNVEIKWSEKCLKAYAAFDIAY